jgi:DNA-binding beta-propeller fold protein YncE
MPGHPFQVVPSGDGCWFYVSVNSSGPRSLNGVAVLRREGGGAALVRVIPVEPEPAGMLLTRDGALLVVADGDQVVFLDTARMRSGQGDAMLGWFSNGEGAGSVYLNCTRDDRTLFVSDEWAQAITVIDLARARSGGFKPDAIVGRIPVGRAPVALTFSPDERYLYTTSQLAAKDWGWSAVCVPEGQDPAPSAPTDPAGAVIVVDVERAKRDPSNSVAARVPAGCHPVRLALSAKGDAAFVTARKSNALLAFDTAKLVGDSTRAGIGSVPVGPAPVGVTVARAGGREVVIVGNSNRFASAAGAADSLSVIDAARIGEGAGAVIGRIPAGRFPRELRVIDEGRTLVVTNFLSDTVELVDLERLSRAWPQR